MNTFIKQIGLAALLATSALVPAKLAFADTPTNGGDIIVTYKDDIATLDPAIGYDWQNWSMINSLFSRLVDYKPGTTELGPSLADSYDVSDDGKVYTFKLHPGVKFSNGRAVTAADVKWSIERAVNPKTQGPGAGFFHSIVGADKMTAGTAETMDGITVVDDHTVKFTLAQPDATFLNVLALNFASVVPKEAVEAAGGDFGKHPVGSGAFTLKEWTIGQRLVFVKNPDYFIKDRPHVDSFTIEVGQEPLVALLRLQKGEVDIAGDGIPPAKFLEMKKSPEFEGMIVDRQQLETSYVTLNTQVKPFDNVKVRQAVNMAINKDRIVRIINGRATPASQVLPPLMPGYDQNYKGYAYDPEKAKALLAEAGFKDGFSTQIYTSNTDPQPRITQAIQQDLAAIGVKAEIKAVANPNVIAAGGTQGQAPMVWSGGLGWIADFPDPSDFYGPILGCGSAVAGGWNWSWYCNKDIDARGVAADAMPVPAKAEERNKVWAQIFTDIQTNDAPWIPVFNERRVVAKSKRMGGPDEIYIDPTRVIDYEAVYVNK
ncbi:ABC transporter substrate-binding protein [Mesorhizobium sp. CU2]|uniref:ABC transporter substrate-binding protein n=1 Tax=unclassified Mesorhizobium TaxID=325217 RepID=UPI00112C7FCD|nr:MULTISPECIES: ABC transporter substrate-binding protein [unclassified Mesorhizobium]TPN78593.1 ABC transporter substrate-binding protein [Mesorhizobium sp. CU3]TPO10433.1 ABC transporter substrate-binding protein [Mesorhizobium sp. CU2]